VMLVTSGGTPSMLQVQGRTGVYRLAFGV